MEGDSHPVLFRGAGVEVRSTTAMSRYWGRAESEHLFTTEVVSRVVWFEAKIGGDLTLEQLQNLRECAALLTHFGGSGARGLGACKYRLEVVEAAEA